jgi:hypothetical protein
MKRRIANKILHPNNLTTGRYSLNQIKEACKVRKVRILSFKGFRLLHDSCQNYIREIYRFHN